MHQSLFLTSRVANCQYKQLVKSVIFTSVHECLLQKCRLHTRNGQMQELWILQTVRKFTDNYGFYKMFVNVLTVGNPADK